MCPVQIVTYVSGRSHHLKQDELPDLGFRLSAPGKIPELKVYGSQPSEEFRLSRGGHMDVAEIAKLANAKTLVLTHIVPMLDEPGVMERLVCEMRGVYNGNIVVGRNLMNVPLTIQHPSRID